jgi:hypothetical protein
MNWKPIEEPEVKWIAVDFDKTLAEGGTFPDFIPGPPLPGAVEAMKRLDERGFKITIFTSRHWADYHNIEKWCEVYGIPVRRILCGKPLYKYLIDDRNIAFDGDWETTISKVK